MGPPYAARVGGRGLTACTGVKQARLYRERMRETPRAIAADTKVSHVRNAVRAQVWGFRFLQDGTTDTGVAITQRGNNRNAPPVRRFWHRRGLWINDERDR
jgi:hypothetical protein